MTENGVLLVVVRFSITELAAYWFAKIHCGKIHRACHFLKHKNTTCYAFDATSWKY